MKFACLLSVCSDSVTHSLVKVVVAAKVQAQLQGMHTWQLQDMLGQKILLTYLCNCTTVGGYAQRSW